MDDLATRANCSNSTVRDFEAARREPHRNRLATIRQALEVAGIVFSSDGAKAGIVGPVAVALPETKVNEKKTPGRAGRSGGTKRRKTKA
jgi:transcriptional regulator with XRE-family HTH domain